MASVRKTSRVVIAHEAHKRLGPGAEIAAMIAEQAIGYLDGPISAGGEERAVPLQPGAGKLRPAEVSRTSWTRLRSWCAGPGRERS